MLRRLSLFTIVTLALLNAVRANAAPVCAVAGNLVQNCGFETGDFTGWTLTGDTVHAGVDAFDAHSGNFGAFIGGFGSINAGDQNFAALSQSLSTIVGQGYLLSFYWAHLTNADVTPDNVFAAFVGTGLATGTLQRNVADQPYIRSLPFYFVATSNATTLQFLAEDANFFFSLDDVTVTPGAPEPATLFLVAPVLAGLFFTVRRRHCSG